MFKWSTSEAIFLAVLGGIATNAVCVSGCGINENLNEAQQERDLAARMAWVDKAINVAERHNLAYRVEVEASGKPSIGETIDLYVDSGVSAKVLMIGNAAAAPKEPLPTVTLPPVDEDFPTNEETVATEEPADEPSGEVTGATEDGAAL